MAINTCSAVNLLVFPISIRRLFSSCSITMYRSPPNPMTVMDITTPSILARMLFLNIPINSFVLHQWTPAAKGLPVSAKPLSDIYKQRVIFIEHIYIMRQVLHEKPLDFIITGILFYNHVAGKDSFCICVHHKHGGAAC